MGGIDQRSLQCADLLDQDLAGAGRPGALARFGFGALRALGRFAARHHPVQIGMVAGLAPAAGRALAAGMTIIARLIAQQPRSQRLGKLALALTGRPGEQDRMRQLGILLAGALPQRLVPGQDHAGHLRPTSSAICAARLAGSALASNTTKRSGSASARRR